MKATDIPGWMDEKEIEWLAEQAKHHNLIVEIGTWLGRSAYAMGEVTPGKIITIDSFKMEGVPPKRWPTAIEAHKEMETDPDWIYRRCLDNLDELITSGKVEVIRGDSLKVIKDLDGIKGQVDMVFIDGSHDYVSVQEDIYKYRPLLKKGGLLCGHDLAHQVKKAVSRLVPDYKLVAGTLIWAAIES